MARIYICLHQFISHSQKHQEIFSWEDFLETHSVTMSGCYFVSNHFDTLRTVDQIQSGG